MPTMTTAEAIVAGLIAHGLDTIYALPGVQNDQLFDALFGSSERIRTVHTRHEQGAAYMALGAALATGKPQATAVVPGPGLLNASAAPNGIFLVTPRLSGLALGFAVVLAALRAPVANGLGSVVERLYA